MSRPPTPPWHLPAPNPRTHRGNRNWNRDHTRRQALNQRWAVRNAANASGAGAVAAPGTASNATDLPNDSNTDMASAPPAAMDTSSEVKNEGPASTETPFAVGNAMDKVLLADRQHLIASVF